MHSLKSLPARQYQSQSSSDTRAPCPHSNITFQFSPYLIKPCSTSPMELSNFDLPPAIGLEQHDILTACNLAVDISHSALICLICKYAISPVSKRLLSHVKQHAHCQQTAQLTSCLRYIPLRKPDDIIPKIHGSSSDNRLILHRGIQCSLCEHISAQERSHKDHAKQQHGNCCLGSPVEYQTWGYLLLATGRWRVSMPADTCVDNSTTR